MLGVDRVWPGWVGGTGRVVLYGMLYSPLEALAWEARQEGDSRGWSGLGA